MLLKLEGFQYATPIDSNMGYYHIRITGYSSNLCTIILPWVEYHYKCIPIVVSNSQDIFQYKMNNLFEGFQFIYLYIDAI